MSWRDRIDPALQGSYRRIPFHVVRSDGQGGRRWLVHEYPRRDRPYAEDMGRKAKEWRLELFVAGDDYDRQRDALIEAFDEPGSATLDHPYLGRFDAVATDVTWSESNRDGGVCTFRVTFSESGEQNLPTTSLDTQLEVNRLADAMQRPSLLDFMSNWSVDGLLGWSLSAVERDITSVVSELDMLVGGIVEPILSAIRRPGEIAGTVLSGYRRIRDAVTSTGRSLQGLARLSDGTTTGAISVPVSAGGDLIRIPELPPSHSNVLLTVSTPNRALRTLRETALSGQAVATQDAVSGLEIDTPERRQRQQNTAAAIQLSGRIATVEAARLVAATDWQTRDDAVAASREVLALLDAQLTTDTPISDTVYAAAVALRAAVVEDLRVRATALPGITTFTPQVITSSLVVAQRLYGDARRADEIAIRNAVRRPGAMSGGIALEVLSE